MNWLRIEIIIEDKSASCNFTPFSHYGEPNLRVERVKSISKIWITIDERSNVGLQNIDAPFVTTPRLISGQSWIQLMNENERRGIDA